MIKVTFETEVWAETFEQAVQVMSERLDHEEDYGFFYEVGYDLKGVAEADGGTLA